jgi:hypothetical protein
MRCAQQLQGRYAEDARLELWHFNIPDHKVAAQNGFAMVLSFPTLTKADISIGSRIMVPKSLWNETRQH